MGRPKKLQGIKPEPFDTIFGPYNRVHPDHAFRPSTPAIELEPVKVRFLSHKCPICNGYGAVGYEPRRIPCHGCGSYGFIVLDNETGRVVENRRGDNVR